jgi:hypothetical protein
VVILCQWPGAADLPRYASEILAHNPPHSSGVNLSACKFSCGWQHFSLRGMKSFGLLPCIFGALALV